MAWITKQRTSKGEIRHLVGWREPVCRHDGKHPEGDRIHESFRTAKEAKIRKRELEDQLERGTHVSKADRQRKLGEYFDSRLADDTERSHSTKTNNRNMFDKHVRPALGARAISSIRGEHIRSVLAGIEGRSAQQKVYAILATTFRQAVADGLIVKTPIERGTVSRPKAKPKTRRIVTLHELYAILDAVEDRYRVPLLVAATAGLRGEEIGGLRVGDIDFERFELHVRQTIVDGEGGPVIGPPKTDNSKREVPVDPRLIDAIQRHLEAYGPADDGRIFTTNGVRGILSTDRLGDAYRRAWKRAEIEPDHDGRVPELHGLRHLAASLMIQRGASIKAMQDYLGHATAKETLDTYGHLMPKDFDRCAEILSEVVAGYAPQTALPAAMVS